MRKYSLLIFVITLSFYFKLSSAGACMFSTGEYLDILAKADVSDTSTYNEVQEALHCLYHWTDYLVMGYEYFASPGALDKVEKMTQPYRDRVYEIVPAYLESDKPFIQEFAVCALAYYKWSESFDYLTECERILMSPKKCVLFAVLGNKRAIPIIIDYYWELEKKYKTKPQFSYPDKMNCLNALYHLASPEILPFIDSIIENPRPPRVLSRAKKVKKRITILYPDMPDAGE